MFKLFRKKKSLPDAEIVPESTSSIPATGELTWDAQATQGLEQAIAQAPVPAMLKGRVRTELKSAAEGVARAEGRNTVTAQDLMQGLLSRLPENMRSKVETAMQGGPDKLKDLEKELRNQ